MAENPLGTICWTDLTVPNADEIRSFYEQVVGWTHTPHDMGDYADFNMISPATEECVTGICHARGVNADVPPVWLVYFQVADAAASAEECRRHGGEIVAGPRAMGNATFCVIRDPAGAMCALFSAGAPSEPT